MKTLKALSLLPLLAGFASAQSVTLNTTLATAMGRGDQTISLTACTSVMAAGLAPVTGLYVDREYMTIAPTGNVNPNGTGCVWNVKRGAPSSGSIQGTHNVGATVWYGNPSQTSGPFDNGPYDRVGACTATNFAYLPLVMIRTGNLITCGTDGAYHKFGSYNESSVGSVVASATTITLTNRVVTVSGTAAIATITAVGAFPGTTVTLLPTGIFTTTNAGNIAIASTAVVGKALIMTLGPTGTWYPSY